MLIMGIVAVQAEQTFYSYILRVNLNDDTSISFKFSDSPIAYFEHNSLIIESTSMEVDNGDFLLDNVKNLTIEKAEFNNISEVTTDTSLLQFEIKGGQLTALGMKAEEQLSVYSLNGALIHTTFADANGYATVNITTLDKGVYVVKTSSNSFKFIK